MIRPPGFTGAAFGTASDGNGRDSDGARRTISSELGIPTGWASLRQVHGRRVLRAEAPGRLGDGDAAFTSEPGLPLSVATADCYPVVVEAPGAVGIAHAGWRGAAEGVVPALVAEMAGAGFSPRRAAIGPGIGPCCFEVGPEVSDRFEGHLAATTWGTRSVDLVSVIAGQLAGITVWRSEICTMCGGGFHSYRRDRTRDRQVGVAWVV